MCHSARGPDLTLPNIGQQLGDIRIQRIRSFQKCSLGEIPPNELIAFCKIILWSLLMIFNDLRKKKKKNMQNKETMQPLDKSEALRPEIFQKLYVSPMKVHGCSSGSHSIYKLFPLRSFHPAEKQLEKRSRSAGPCFAKSRNTGIDVFLSSRMFYPHRNGQGHPMPPSGWETSGSNRIRLSGPKVLEDLLRWWIFFEMTFRTSLFCLKRVSFSVHIVEGCFRLLYFS